MSLIPTFQLGKTITDEQRAALAEIGAIRFEGVASPEEVVTLRRAWDTLCDDFVRHERRIVNGTPIKFGHRPDGSRYVNRFAFASQFSPEIRAFVRDERFEAIRQLCGADMRVAEDEKDGVVINCYRNEDGSRYKRLGWHTDGLRDIFLGQRLRPMYNIGFYFDDATEENGLLGLIPGSHTQGKWRMLTRKLYFVDHRDDPSEVLLSAKAGDVTIHDGRLWHRVTRGTATGDASTRRTMYVPYINGPYRPKSPESKTPLYHRFQWITG